MNCNQPVLAAKEYKNLAAATQIIQIDVPQGLINVSDSVLPRAPGAFSLKVDPGLYNLCAYLLINKSSTGKHIVVAAKAECATDNVVYQIPELNL